MTASRTVPISMTVGGSSLDPRFFSKYTIKGTISAEYLRGHGARVQEFTRLEDMYQALLDKRVDAVLLGAPVLRYYAAHDGKGLVRMVGQEFNKGEVALAFVAGSPLRREVNTTLLSVREDGTYARIYQKWFGTD